MPSPVFFIADLHLCPAHANTNQLFEDFIADIFLPQGDTLYILGDFFEYWIGDDGYEKLGYRRQVELLSDLTHQGKQVYFMHGNRDFMVSEAFSKTTGVTIVDDPAYVEIGNKKCLLKHGDDLCTDDIEHQKFRVMTRNPQWQASVMSKSIDERLALASQLRQMSGSSYKPLEIMDVSEPHIKQTFIDNDIDIMIHGHTHRPAIHDYQINGKACKRYVLGDWHADISYLKVDDNDFELVY